MSTKLVNGVRVDVPPSQEAELDARTPPTVRPEFVRREAERRIAEVASTREILRLMQRSLRLIMKVAVEGRQLSAAEQAEIAQEQSKSNQIEAIQAAEKRLLAMGQIPRDFMEDRWWTA